MGTKDNKPQLPARVGKGGASVPAPRPAAGGSSVPDRPAPAGGVGAVRRIGIELRTPLIDTGLMGVKIDPVEVGLKAAGVPTLPEILAGTIVGQSDEKVGAGWQRVYRIELPPQKRVELPLKMLGGDVLLVTDAGARPWLTVPIGLAAHVRPQVQAWLVSEQIVATASGRSVAFQLDPKQGAAFTIPVFGQTIGLKVLGWKQG